MTPYPLTNVVREPADERDFLVSIPVTLSLPAGVDLRQYSGPIEDQLTLGSCTANATVSALEMLLQRAGKFEHLSRLFVYFNVREGYANLRGKDGGAYLSDGFKSCRAYGCPVETLWPYDVAKVHTKPTENVFEEALRTKVGKYERVARFGGNDYNHFHSIQKVKAMLAMGYAVPVSLAVTQEIFGMTGLLSNPSCHYTRPAVTIAEYVGGHAVNLVGYNAHGFIAENSWGTEYGDKGYFILGFDVLAADGFDAWVCSEFADVDQAPDWTYSPVVPLTATLPPVAPVFVKSAGAGIAFSPVLEVGVNGGEGPFEYKWVASNKDVVFTTPAKKVLAQAAVGGWKTGETRSITITCSVYDCSLPTQQVATASISMRVTNGVEDAAVDGNRAKALRLYRAAFRRLPDQGGLDYWTTQMDNGAQLVDVAGAFIGSDEFVRMYGATSPQQFVTLLYQNVLNRLPDAGGLAFWAGRIVAGEPRQNILVGFSESDENKAVTN